MLILTQEKSKKINKKSFLLHQTSFFTSVNSLRDLPKKTRNEVAFVGRSNAGKSTAINVLCNRRTLAFSSKKPGRTRYINFFIVGSKNSPSGFIVDLPGYGYVEKRYQKEHWNCMLSNYFKIQEALKGVVLVTDSRRPLSILDTQMVHWLCLCKHPIHILLTKADKLTQKERNDVLYKTRTVIHQFNQLNRRKHLISVQLFSSAKRIGFDEAHTVIENWLVE